VSYCPDHYPLLRAGFRLCGICRAIGFPVDAEWVSDALILVTYGASCQHTKSTTILIDPDDITQADIDPAKHVPGRRCTGRNKRGRSCRSCARPGSDFCRAHQLSPQLQGGS
jgi:hypothetical protein